MTRITPVISGQFMPARSDHGHRRLHMALNIEF